jgi:predicted membrane protein
MVVRALRYQILVASMIAFLAFFFGILLPFFTGGAIHNPFWELIFGIGFWVSERFPGAYNTPIDALFGFLLWPIAVVVAVWFVTFWIARWQSRGRLALGTLFILSLAVCVGNDLQNKLAIHVPLWSNEYFVRY